MSARTDELKQTLEADHNQVRSLFESLTAEDFAKKTNLGWPVGQLAGHLASAPGSYIFVSKRLAQGKNAELPGFLSFMLNVGNGWTSRKFRSTTSADLVAHCDKGHQMLLDFVSALSDEQLDRGGVVMGIGQRTTYDFLKSTPDHSQEHSRSMHGAIGR